MFSCPKLWTTVAKMPASMTLTLLLVCVPIIAAAASVSGDQETATATQFSRQKRATCGPGDCKNGGVCNTLGSGPTCLCPLPFTGQVCNVLIDYCNTAQPESGIDPTVVPVCLNGTCLGTTLTEPYFNCSCLPGFNGSRCQFNIDDCASQPCLNGQCRDLVNNFSCSCYRGWEGRSCAANANDCFAGACLNGGRCIDGNSSYSCNCTDTGFRGANCSENIDDCAAPSNPCANAGACIDGVKNYTCSCMAGYTGRNCTTDMADCSPNPCQYNGTCLERSSQALYGNASLPFPFHGAFNYSLAAGFVCLCPTGSSGSTCSVNPDDCVVPGTNRSVCAHASSCTDGLASFTCHCLPGYEGKNCSVDINECELFRQPCQNGAACKDLVADYACTDCPSAFGGKNCSVRLTGCDSNWCQNNATCVPILVQELPTPVHGYRCTCKAGWSGPQCNVTTLASFNGASSFSVLLSNRTALRSDWTFEFSFRTTLAQFDLIRLSSDWGVIRIGAHDSSLMLLLMNTSSFVIGQAKWPIGDSLASADWLTLSVALANGSATLTRIGSGVGQPQRQLVGGLSDRFKLANITVHVGGERGSAIDSGGFRGCVRDLRLLESNSTFVATETSVESSNATWGVCSRSVQCGSPSPCELRTSSKCSDLWNDFVCHCAADFGGRNCSVQLPSFSFGMGGNASSASFSSLPAVSSVYGGDSWTIELRLVTLSPGAFLMLLGDPSDSSTTPRLLATIDRTGRLSTQLLHSNGSQIAALTSPDSVATGSSVSVKISLSISGREMSLTVSSTVRLASLSSAGPLSQLSGQLIIGGFSGASAAPAPALVVVAGGVGRAKRSAPVLPASVASAADNETAFRGVLSSCRVNGDRPLILGPVPSSLIDSLPGAVAASDSTDVVAGAATENVCGAFAPCRNGATCTDIFYNSYSCNCTVGWRGVNCTVRDHCYTGADFCPNGTECVNLEPIGFECRTAATFGSSLQSTPTNQLILSVSRLSEALATVAGGARTRQSDCQLLSVSSGSRQLSVGCSSGQLRVSLDDQIALVAVSIATGSPFAFSVNCSVGAPLTLSLSLNGSDVSTASSKSAIATSFTLNSTARVTLGGSGYKGCLDNVRLNGYLAPLANRSLPTGASGFNWSSASAPLIGCHGDQVCQTTADGRSVSVCRNSGRCTDLWNKFQCECTAGFYGATCSDSLGATASVSTAVIIAVCVVGLVIIIVIVAAVLFKFVQSRRRETGTYGPSKAESRGNSHAQAPPPVRPPPEERLI